MKAIEAIEAALANRADDSFIHIGDCITVAQVRELMDEIKQITFAANCLMLANNILGGKLLEDREGKLVKAPGKRPETSAPAMVFFPTGSLGEEVAA